MGVWLGLNRCCTFPGKFPTRSCHLATCTCSPVSVGKWFCKLFREKTGRQDPVYAIFCGECDVNLSQHKLELKKFMVWRNNYYFYVKNRCSLPTPSKSTLTAVTIRSSHQITAQWHCVRVTGRKTTVKTFRQPQQTIRNKKSKQLSGCPARAQ